MKKVSVGNNEPPKKSKMKGYVIIAIVVAVLIIMFMMTTGCSSDDSTTPTATPTSVFSAMQNDINGLESRVLYLEDHPVTSAATITNIQDQLNNLIADDDILRSQLATHINTSVVFNTTSIDNQISLLNASITFLGVRLTALELAHTVTPTPTPVPNASATPTPTPTPSGNHAPLILFMNTSCLDSLGKNWMVSCLANDSDGDILSYDWAVTNGMVMVMATHDMVIWSLTTNASTQSIACQVSDGRGGYDIAITSVYYP